MKLRFAVKGSAAEPYVVIIERVGDNLTATCDCPAGLHGQFCKHRLSLFKGSAKGVVDGDAARIPDIPGMVEGTDVAIALAAVAEAEAEAEAAKKKLSIAKKALARAMND